MKTIVVVAGAAMLLLAGCAAVQPPEVAIHNLLRGGDPESRTCNQGTGEMAIAACSRILDRPEPTLLPMAFGGHLPLTSAVYESRGDTALMLARRLSDAGREHEAAAALSRSIGFFKRATTIMETWAGDDPRRLADKTVHRTRIKQGKYAEIYEKVSRTGGPLASLLTTTPAVLPPPPLFPELTSGTPSEYRPQRLPWPAGRMLVYRVIQYSETVVEGESPAKRSASSTVSIGPGQETAPGARRIDFVIDDKRVGAAFVDANGELTDVSAEMPSLEPLLRSAVALAGAPAVHAYFSSSLVKGRRYEGRVSAKTFLVGDALSTFGGFATDEWVVAYELLAYRIVSGREVAEIQSSIPNVLKRALPSRLSPTVTVMFNSLSAVSRDYVDLVTGIGVAKYESVDLLGQVQGKAIRHRSIVSAQLDLNSSRL